MTTTLTQRVQAIQNELIDLSKAAYEQGDADAITAIHALYVQGNPYPLESVEDLWSQLCGDGCGMDENGVYRDGKYITDLDYRDRAILSLRVYRYLEQARVDPGPAAEERKISRNLTLLTEQLLRYDKESMDTAHYLRRVVRGCGIVVTNHYDRERNVSWLKDKMGSTGQSRLVVDDTVYYVSSDSRHVLFQDADGSQDPSELTVLRDDDLPKWDTLLSQLNHDRLELLDVLNRPTQPLDHSAEGSDPGVHQP